VGKTTPFFQIDNEHLKKFPSWFRQDNVGKKKKKKKKKKE
jgi:hypothetical protein